MRAYAVIGLGFGDEGKGKAVSTLVSKCDKPLVVRFCGGQQAGHKVVLCAGAPGHVFSNFGSGTLQGAPTYWTRFCTFEPVGMLKERELLQTLWGIAPVLYVDERCPITTFADIRANQCNETDFKNGTCGVGVGQTIQREQDHYSLTVRDLKYPSVLRIKMRMILNYYNLSQDDRMVKSFLDACEEAVSVIKIVGDWEGVPHTGDIIYEGSQGILLDKDVGFFPHVTRSNTGMDNVPYATDILFVIRAYQTRHGNGPMTNQQWPLRVLDNPHEHNTTGEFQGAFRSSLLDLDLLKYARDTQGDVPASLLITCMDLLEEYQFTVNGKIRTFSNARNFANEVRRVLRVDEVYLSWSPYPGWEEVVAHEEREAETKAMLG